MKGYKQTTTVAEKSTQRELRWMEHQNLGIKSPTQRELQTFILGLQLLDLVSGGST